MQPVENKQAFPKIPSFLHIIHPHTVHKQFSSKSIANGSLCNKAKQSLHWILYVPNFSAAYYLGEK